MESSLQFATSPFCTGVLDLVIYGHIAARNGVSLLCSLRKMGSPEERKCAVAALRYLTNCPDKDLARSCRIAFHELYIWKTCGTCSLSTLRPLHVLRRNMTKLPQLAHLFILHHLHLQPRHRFLARLVMRGHQSIYNSSPPLKV